MQACNICRSGCGSGVAVAEDAARIGQIRVRVLQPGVSAGAEPADAQAAAQGAVEGVEEGSGGGGVVGGEEEGVCLPGAELPAPRCAARAGGSGGDKEALPEKAQQQQAVGLREVLERVRRSVGL